VKPHEGNICKNGKSPKQALKNKRKIENDPRL